MSDEIYRVLNIEVSVSRCIYYRKLFGYNWRKTKKRPYLTEKQKQERLQFALKYRNSSLINWLFMDETTCMTYIYRRYHMRKRSSRPPAIAITRRNCQKINVWGAIGWNGAIRFKVNLNYKDIYFIILN